MATFERTVEFEVYTCCHKGCGIQFGLSAQYVAHRRKDHAFWYCPSGHSQHFSGMTDEQRRLKEAEAKAQRLQIRADKAEQRASAVNRQYKKIRDRVKNGVCPCCNRTFQNLADHMRTKHADFGNHDLLKALRGAYGLTQGALAEEVWVSPSYISMYENSKPVPEHARGKIESWLTAQTA